MVSQLVERQDLVFTSQTTTLVREIPADLETPISVYLKLAGIGPSFLLESVTGGEQVARYSFIGVHPSKAFVFWRERLQVFSPSDGLFKLEQERNLLGDDPLTVLRSIVQEREFAPVPGLPRFAGGLVGYLGYELMRYFEPTVDLASHPVLPEAIFLQADILVAFDHAFGRLVMVGNTNLDVGLTAEELEAQFDEIEDRLKMALPCLDCLEVKAADSALRSNLTEAEFAEMVQQAKEHIAAGDIFQVVLSQCMHRATSAAPFEIYRTLRRLNPSPYMFFFDFGQLSGEEPMFLIGASPEMHARLEGRIASVRPIAGTRKRGKTPVEDTLLAEELLLDPKERAEHVMLVDLGRNDLGRICEYGSVSVPEKMLIERYSHVMHIVSHVMGELRPEFDAFDLLRATFPAGTVSGAPKIRAMQIINELEPEPRGVYAGAVGYFSYDGSMDTCIAIRTMVMRGQSVTLQAGAGIVADSVPANEYQESLNKLRALAVAIDLAEKE